MFTVDRYPHGCFSWVDLNTPDARAARHFYCGLLGWETRDDLPHTHFLRGGQVVAGLNELSTTTPGWNSHVTVADVDALLATVEATGGKIFTPPRDIMGRGRLAIIRDPDDAELRLWQPQADSGATLVNAPGALCWNDVYTLDAARAREFYGTLFGWRFRAEGQGYHRIHNQGRGIGGVLSMDEEMRQYFRPQWMVYFSVTDIADAATAVEELGGELIVPPHDAPRGRFLLFADPQGALCSLFQLERTQPWQEKPG